MTDLPSAEEIMRLRLSRDRVRLTGKQRQMLPTFIPVYIDEAGYQHAENVFTNEQDAINHIKEHPVEGWTLRFILVWEYPGPRTYWIAANTVQDMIEEAERLA